MNIRHLALALASVSVALGAALSCGSDARTEPARSRSPVFASRVDAGPSVDAGTGSGLGPVPQNVPPNSCGGLLGASVCDPVTAWPCDVAAGQTCDFSNLAGSFRCMTLPNTVPFCGVCDDTLWCGPGTICGYNRCERYCCADSDCERGPCVKDILGTPSLAAAGFCPGDSVAACGTDWFADAGENTLASNGFDAGNLTTSALDAAAP
jgi:hypothetical protein